MLLKLVKGDRVLLTVFCVVCFGTLVRLCVNLHPYSGKMDDKICKFDV